MASVRRDAVALNLVIPRTLRRQLKLLAAHRETSLRQLAREALEQLVAGSLVTSRDVGAGKAQRA